MFIHLCFREGAWCLGTWPPQAPYTAWTCPELGVVSLSSMKGVMERLSARWANAWYSEAFAVCNLISFAKLVNCTGHCWVGSHWLFLKIKNIYHLIYGVSFTSIYCDNRVIHWNWYELTLSLKIERCRGSIGYRFYARYKNIILGYQHLVSAMIHKLLLG